MKLLNHSLLCSALVSASFLVSPKAFAQNSDPGWPREHYRDGTRLIVYQPQVDDWKDFQNLSWRMAVAVTPKGGKEILGVVEMKGLTMVDNVDKLVLITQMEITGLHFPPASTAQVEPIIKSFIPPSITISLHRVIASTPKAQPPSSVELNNDPPKIFVGYRPSILLSVDGPPVMKEVPNTNLKFVVNTQWPIFFDGSNYFAPAGQVWLSATSLDGEWTQTKKLPPAMAKVPQDKEWTSLKKIIPPPQSGGIVPAVFYSDKPAVAILFDGQPVYAQIPNTQLTYATNTNSVVFVYTPTQQFYYLVAGRWFSANDLQGPWTFATPNLPADFAKIPASSPASAVLASVPGTDAAKDALLLAQVPTSMTVKADTAAANVKVQYGGDPHFETIKGTSMEYATNTNDKVIKVGDVYYLCLQGVWFLSPSPQGPWTTAESVPKEIYTIPSSSPVYNVTYVTQTANPDGTVQASYTAGYLGAFVLGAATGAIIADGTGYWGVPSYAGGAYYPYATPYGGAYYGAAHYNSATGAYGWSQTASGPYGSATRGAAYNPYTGTAARAAAVSTPYGSRAAGQAYNPYTGTYAQTRQGSSPTSQWGSSNVSRGNQSASMGHYSTANGTVAGASTSQGGKMAASSTAWGNSAAAKTASGNMYAGHDGNVYKNTGSGWESYNNGSWNSVNKQPQPNFSQATQSRAAGSGYGSENRSNASGYDRASAGGSGEGERGGFAGEDRSSEMQNMQRESENRSRGDDMSNRFQGFQRGGGDRFGGGGDRFGGGGFGGRGGGGFGGRGGGGRRR